jgi:Spy/CpxP family protein refolding chaperone
MRQRIHDKLNLTDEQEDKVESLRIEHQKKMIDLRATLQKARLDSKDIRSNKNISRSEVISSVEKLNKIKNEISLAAANHRMDVYETLTPEQQEIWKDLKKDFSRKDMKFKRHGMKDGSGRQMMR